MGLVCMIGECGAGELPEDIPAVRISGFGRISCPDAVIIAGEGAEFDVKQALAVIVDENYKGRLPRGVQLITCGISGKNTVSVTSRTDDKITLALNRSIRTSSGVIEPMEQPVAAKKEYSEFDLMAEFVTKLLLQ